MKIYLNVRGANNVKKRKLMKAYLKMQKVDLVCKTREIPISGIRAKS